MVSLASCRNSIDSSDQFYVDEMAYWDETNPKISVFVNQFYQICLDYPLKDELNIPNAFFKIANCSLKSFDEKIIEEVQLENKLVNQYRQFMAQATIEFENKVYSYSAFLAKLSDNDRSVRKRAFETINRFFEKHEDFFDQNYDSLVKVRHAQAIKLGYDNYVQLGYYRMMRLDYDQNAVENFRKQVVDEIVPIVTKLNIDRKNRLGLDKLAWYDRSIYFKTGNPKPKGSVSELVAQAQKMYQEMSKETGEFFQVMLEKQLFDLESKANKMPGGYCTEFSDYKVPFIFANFNGTSHDVDVLTHEAGHAFQSYLTAQNNDIIDCAFPTMETCEIHSMSMEFIAYPWMNNFFKEDTEKYYYLHLVGALSFLPYGCLIDHFQHGVYQNPAWTPSERKAYYHHLETIYLSDLDYQDAGFLEKGTYWFRQGHVFEMPFYYIDYCLAQICALQFFNRILNKDPNYWQDYLLLCKNGGTLTFLENLKASGLDSPFEEGCIKKITDNMLKEIAKYNVQSL